MMSQQSVTPKVASATQCAIMIASLFLASASPALGLECPAPQQLSRPGILKETQAQIEHVTTLLATGDDSNRIQRIVDDLRTRYPNVENAEVINYLMTAYCPVVAQLSGLSEQEKQGRMDHFVSELSQILY